MSALRRLRLLPGCRPENMLRKRHSIHIDTVVSFFFFFFAAAVNIRHPLHQMWTQSSAAAKPKPKPKRSCRRVAFSIQNERVGDGLVDKWWAAELEAVDWRQESNRAFNQEQLDVAKQHYDKTIQAGIDAQTGRRRKC